MELTEIKSRVLGYSKKDVCRYISDMNDIHAAEMEAQKQSAKKTAENYESQLKALSAETKKLAETLEALEAELKETKETLEKVTTEKEEISASYVALESETEELRSKSDVISTAIINAEKCATTMINDATERAKDMVGKAEEKVDAEVKRLEVAKTYITAVRAAALETLRKIDAELGEIEDAIVEKAHSVRDEESKKSSVREKFGLLDKTIIKKA